MDPMGMFQHPPGDSAAVTQLYPQTLEVTNPPLS